MLHRLRRALADHLGSRQVSRVIYGAVVGLALVVGLQQHPPTPGVMIGTLLATAVTVSLAELYSELVGAETRTKTLHIPRENVERTVTEVAATALGVSFPSLFFVLAAAGAIDTSTAFTVAKWSGVGLIAFYGFCAARLAGGSLATAALHASAVGVIGGILIAVKSVLH